MSSYVVDHALPGWSDVPSFHPSCPGSAISSRTWKCAHSHVPIPKKLNLFYRLILVGLSKHQGGATNLTTEYTSTGKKKQTIFPETTALSFHLTEKKARFSCPGYSDTANIQSGTMQKRQSQATRFEIPNNIFVSPMVYLSFIEGEKKHLQSATRPCEHACCQQMRVPKESKLRRSICLTNGFLDHKPP